MEDNMKDYYLQSLVDFYWKTKDYNNARFNCFEFLLTEYKLGNISLEQFNILFNITLGFSQFYESTK